jgi:hypothetical protein
MARGRKPKNKIQESPTVQALVEKVTEVGENTGTLEQKLTEVEWDVRIGDPIDYFDSNLSYELTGYRPIDGTRGLDFDPEWFMEARKTKATTGKYCNEPLMGKAYGEFWDQEYDRCRNGMTVNGYTITGDNYFFINYYQLPNLSSATKAGGGRSVDFPNFFVKQYEYFHYIELCKMLRKNAIGLKARGVGFSEIAAAILVNGYTTRPHFRGVVAAQQEGYVDDTLSKCWTQLSYLDDNTEDGMRWLRQVHNTAKWKRASSKNVDGVESGWMSEIEGITADKPNKIRGDRTDILMYEESGSWPNWKKAFIQGDALIDIQGQRFGIKLAWGTGGDSGPALEGVAAAFHDPRGYDVLPYKHNYTKEGTYVETAYFIPAYTIVTAPGYVDHRGWTDPEKGREFYMAKRATKIADPKGLMLYSAEYCFTPDEALALEGDNQFNTVLLTEQLAAIKLHKITPQELKPKWGQLEYTFQNNVHSEEAKNGVRFIPSDKGKVCIIEHPIKSENGADFRNLYVAGIDGIDMGMNDTSDSTRDPSDFCVVVKKRCFGLQEPMYVCIYKDRPNNLEEAYRTTLKILEYYNCKACLESTRISILTWFRTKKKEERFLMRRPRATQSDIQAGRSRQFGAPATEAVIQHQLDLIDCYINDYCHNMWFEPMINELITYSYENKRKFDIVAAMGMAELGDEELSGIPPQEADNGGRKLRLFGYWTDEYGIKHKGVIPDKQSIVPKFNLFPTQYYDDTGHRTSNPRFN